jgi:hypothetical protein
MQTTNGINLLGVTSTGTFTSAGMWNPMILKETNEVGESIEMIYTQTSMYSRTGGLPLYHDKRAVKIIYSCVDGKWNKSEPIYGKIIPAQDEYFEFED